MSFIKSVAQRLVFRRYNSSLIKPIHPSLLQKIPSIKSQYEEILKDEDSFDAESGKQMTSLQKILNAHREYTQTIANLQELKEIVKSGDQELLEDAVEEMKSLIPIANSQAVKLSNELLPPLPDIDKPCLIELRPGVGGVEAMIFTKDLLDMYVNLAQQLKWNYKILSEQENQSGLGLIGATMEISTPHSYNIMRHESGIHRVQRIPHTETKGRTHTSTAAVIVLPKQPASNKKVYDDREFKPGEIRIDIKRASGKGGQHVNTTDSAVRLLHFPTGIIISMQDERSQHKNKEKAFKILREKLAELDRNQHVASEKKMRTEQVTTTDRSDKIRTYNFVQNRITDHRCGFSIHDVPGCFTGTKLLEITKKLEAFELEKRLSEL